MERFDAYLNNEMSDHDRKIFEEELNANPKIRAEFNEHKSFLNDLNEGASYHEIRSTLRMIHKKPGVGERNFFTSPHFLIPLSMAAAIALIVTIINPFVKQGNESMSADNSDDKYLTTPAESAESYEMDSTSVADTHTERDNSQMPNVSSNYVTPSEERTAGTVFMLSNQGYFITVSKDLGEEDIVKLQSSDHEKTFEALVIYKDPENHIAILQCHPDLADRFETVPYVLDSNEIKENSSGFIHGFAKSVIEYRSGKISKTDDKEEKAWDYLIEAPMSSNGYGAPVFSAQGKLIGIVSAENNSKSNVTIFISRDYIVSQLDYLRERDGISVEMKNNVQYKTESVSDRQRVYEPFIFELHP